MGEKEKKNEECIQTPPLRPNTSYSHEIPYGKGYHRRYASCFENRKKSIRTGYRDMTASLSTLEIRHNESADHQNRMRVRNAITMKDSSRIGDIVIVVILTGFLAPLIDDYTFA